MTSVLAAVDGSDGSRRAASFARDVAQAFRARLIFLHVIEPLQRAGVHGPDESASGYYARQMQWATEFLRDLADELRVRGSEQIIEMGRPGDVICREAHERNADLIVLGAHGHGSGSRLILGSVAGRAAASATGSVTIVR
jgi:nucleotide-binding universal stress UspA family protein